MKRRHLFEFEDLEWFPQFLRNYGTDYLRFLANQFDMFRQLVPDLRRALKTTGQNRIIDLASGGSGGLMKLSNHLDGEIDDLDIVLTDLYPNMRAFQFIKKHGGGKFSFRKESINAMDVPDDLKGFRTMFLSFHHFKPDDAIKILQNAVDDQAPIAIVEGTDRSWKRLFSMLLTPIIVTITTPFILPFSPGRLFFTYVIPVMQPFIMWDGIVSVLRTYTLKEMEEMTKKIKGGDHYHWEIGSKKDGPNTVLYMFGWPDKFDEEE